jgi:competence protein ComGC
MIKKASRQDGFTVLEMSLILVAVSLLVGVYLSFYRPGNVMQATAQSRLKIDRVLNAVSAYALQYNRVPCPADPNVSQEENRGQGRGACGGALSYGIIPYRDLGLSQEDAQDAFGYYMTYVVSVNITSAAGAQNEALKDTRSHFCNTALTSDLQLYRNSTLVSNANERIYVAVISHGPDGIGSYNIPSPNRFGDLSSLATAEAENAGTTRRININNYQPMKSSPTVNDKFDDIVGVLRRSDIIYRVNHRLCAP